MKVNNFEYLPDDKLLKIALNLNLGELINYCQLSARFNNVICSDNWFWYNKFIHDYGSKFQYDKNTDWLHIYQYYGNVLSFGNNTYGQLGLGLELGDNVNRNVPTQIHNIKAQSVSAGGHTVMIDLNNNVWSFGYNYYGQLGLGDKMNRNVPTKIPNLLTKIVSVGYAHTIMIDLNNNVWSFGVNNYGELGLGDKMKRNVPTKIPNLLAQSVSSGSNHTIIIDLNNNVWSFGFNYYDQLGLGKLSNLKMNIAIKGDDVIRNVPTQIPNLLAQSISVGDYHSIIPEDY